jgi:hypothetical protein
VKTTAKMLLAILPFLSLASMASAREHTIDVSSVNLNSLDCTPIKKNYSVDEDDTLIFKVKEDDGKGPYFFGAQVEPRGYLKRLSAGSDPVLRYQAVKPGTEIVDVVYNAGTGPIGPSVVVTILVRPLQGPAAAEKAEKEQAFKAQLSKLAATSYRDPNFEDSVNKLLDLADSDPLRERREQALLYLKTMGPNLEAGLEDWLSANPIRHCGFAIRACGLAGCTNTVPVLRKILKSSPDVDLKRCAITSLGQLNDKDSIRLIAPYLDDSNGLVRDDARYAMVKLTASEYKAPSTRFPTWDDWWKAVGAGKFGIQPPSRAKP